MTGDNRQVRVLSKCIIITIFTTLIEQSAQFTPTPGSIAHGSARAGATAPTVARPGSITVKEGVSKQLPTSSSATHLGPACKGLVHCGQFHYLGKA